MCENDKKTIFLENVGAVTAGSHSQFDAKICDTSLPDSTHFMTHTHTIMYVHSI